MSQNTSYRYEVMMENTGLQSALLRQKERIRQDEIIAAREHQAKLEMNLTLKSEWNESQSHAAAVRKQKDDGKQFQDELCLAQRASIMVRRAALKKLLEEDYTLYEKELHALGKAFYLQRT